MNMTTEKNRAPRRLARTVLIAAVVAVLLCATAAAAWNSGFLQNRFAQLWYRQTGQEMSKNQAHLIDGLTEEISQSVTVDGVTVTLDSITVGDETVWAYLKVTGAVFSMDKEYSFAQSTIEVTPHWGIKGYCMDRMTWHDDEDILHVYCIYAQHSGTQPPNFVDGGHTLRVSLKDMICEDVETVLEGEWEFSVPLTEKSASPVITVSQAQVTQDGTPVTVTDVRVTSTGIRLCTDGKVSRAQVVFADGTVVWRVLSGGGSVGAYYYQATWPAPLDVEEIVALRIGDTEIPMN